MNGNKRPLYIPIKTLDSDDYIEGIGKLEVALISVCILSGIILGIFISEMLQNGLVGVMVGIVVAIMAVCIFKRDSTNENLIRKVSIIQRFIKKQKHYLYQYYNIFEHVDISEEEEVNNE